MALLPGYSFSLCRCAMNIAMVGRLVSLLQGRPPLPFSGGALREPYGPRKGVPGLSLAAIAAQLRPQRHHGV